MSLRIPIVIVGESGAGKSYLSGAMARGPWLVLDCARLDNARLECELFGWTEGAYTGAVGSSAGRLVEADGGYVVLEHCDELDESSQAKLLRVVETGEIQRVGGGRTQLEFGTVAVVKRGLDVCVQNSQLRSDFAQRLAGLTVHIEPLRDHLDHMPALFRGALRQECDWDGSLRGGALRALKEHSWPGNMWEIKAVARRVGLTVGKGAITGRLVREAIWWDGERDVSSRE